MAAEVEEEEEEGNKDVSALEEEFRRLGNSVG